MILKIRLDPDADRDLIQALSAMPPRSRTAQVKTLLRLALAGTGGLLVRIEALERQMAGLVSGSVPTTASAPPPKPTVSAQKAAMGLLKKFGALDD